MNKTELKKKDYYIETGRRENMGRECLKRDSRVYRDHAAYTHRKDSRIRRRGLVPGMKIRMFALLTALLLLVAGGPIAQLLTPGSTVVNADECLTELRYKTVKIQSEDSLWSIAEDNMDPGFKNIYGYIREVKKINHLDSDVITAGCYLTVPYYEYKTAE